jgi:hypothetical protein
LSFNFSDQLFLFGIASTKISLEQFLISLEILNGSLSFPRQETMPFSAIDFQVVRLLMVVHEKKLRVRRCEDIRR